MPSLPPNSNLPVGGCPSALDLSAYLDDFASPTQRDAIEGHLADCAACLAAVRDARVLLATSVQARTEVPPAVVRSARALVPSPRRAGRPSREHLRIADWLSVGRWGLSAAASIALCIAGYRVGNDSFLSRQATSSELVGAMTFGILGTPDAGTDVELLALALQEADR